jgi:adenylate kinase
MTEKVYNKYILKTSAQSAQSLKTLSQTQFLKGGAVNKTKANVNSTKDVIAMLDDLIDDNTKTLKKEITMKKVAKKVDKKAKADKKATKEERRLRIEKAAKKTDKQVVKKVDKKAKATKKVDKKAKAEKATKKAERAAKKAGVDKKAARKEKIAWEAEKKAEEKVEKRASKKEKAKREAEKVDKKIDRAAKAAKRAGAAKKAKKKVKAADSAGATKVMQSFVDDCKPAEIRTALLSLTQAKRNFLRRAIDKVDLTVEKKAATAKVNKPDKKVKAEKKDKFVREIVRIKKDGTPLKTAYVSFNELAVTLKIGKPVEVAVYSTLGKGRGKQRFLTGYKIVTRIAKDKQTVKKSKRSVDTE